MQEVLRTNDPVLASFVESVLGDAGIRVLVADVNMSVLEGSLGVLPRRVLVGDDDVAAARRLIATIEAGSPGGIIEGDGDEADER
jgi:hypothetical protein